MGFITSLLCFSSLNVEKNRSFQSSRTSPPQLNNKLKTFRNVSSQSPNKQPKTDTNLSSSFPQTNKNTNDIELSSMALNRDTKLDKNKPVSSLAYAEDLPNKFGEGKDSNTTDLYDDDGGVNITNNPITIYQADTGTGIATTSDLRTNYPIEDSECANATDIKPAMEVTIIHESEKFSTSDESNLINQNGQESIGILGPYTESEERIVDLTLLQHGQSYVPGCNTLLPPKKPEFTNKKCLVLDLDETLVHSSFKYLRTANFVIPVEIDDQIHNVYVIKRPKVDEFLKKVGELYEVVVFTASVARYGDPLLDILDKSGSIHHRLFRDSCYNYGGNYIKNLSQLGRPLNDLIILDNSPASYIFHPQHAIPISSWFSDIHDNELLDILPLLEDLSRVDVYDVSKVLDVTI